MFIDSARLASLCLLVGLACTTGAARADASGGCGEPATPIHVIQGRGLSSPLVGSEVVVEGVVVGSFQGFDAGIGGFFLQEEDAEADGDPETSEGLFVFDLGFGVAVREGQHLRVRGEVREFFGLTELDRVSELTLCPRRGAASAARVELPLADLRDWERFEGMRVRVDQTLVASELFDLGRFGEVELAAGGRLWQPTQCADPGGPALALADRNDRHRLLLDDGSDAFHPEPIPYGRVARGQSLRIGDRLARLEGVVEFAFGRYRVHPTREPAFEAGGKRPASPPRVGGTLRVAAWNVANYFNGDGAGGGFPTRGAASAFELSRQRAKLVETLARLSPDLVALVELENDGSGPGSAIRELADALSQRLGEEFAAIDPGRPRLGRHAIAVGALYRPRALAPLGAPAVLDGSAHPDFDDARNRPSLAQSFEARATGERFTLVVNHWKSKGSPCDAAGDPDTGDGQGNCNATRRSAARALAEWLAGDPTSAGGVPVIVVGDLNAYPREDPLVELRAAGLVDLLGASGEPHAYSFVFDGEAGRLDHALGSVDLLPHLAGVAVWNINSDEPPLLDYRAENPDFLYAPDPFRSSDHDPLILGLFPDADGDGWSDARAARPRALGSALWRRRRRALDRDHGAPRSRACRDGTSNPVPVRRGRSASRGYLMKSISW